MTKRIQHQNILCTLFLCLSVLFISCHTREKGNNHKAYNVILISLDTLRADHLGCYGYDRPASPNIDRLAAKGTLFENVTSASPWTLPSHISLFTSLYPPAHGVEQIDLALPASESTLAEIMRKHGYLTGGFTGGVFLKSDYGFARGFDIYEDHRTRRLNKILPPALVWLEENRKSKFFLFLHCYDIHFPYYPEDPYYRKIFAGSFNRVPFEKLESIIEQWNRDRSLSDADMEDLVFIYYKYFDEVVRFNQENHIKDMKALHKKLTAYINHEWQKSSHYLEDLELVRGLYDGEILATDNQLGQLFDLLTENNLWENTLLLIVSDHGEGFKEHGLLGHSTNLYDELLKIPLIMVFPEKAYRGLRITQHARIIDVMPTILDYLGIAMPGNLKMQGTSLLPMLNGHSMDLPAFASARKAVNISSLVWKDYKLIIDHKKNTEELYSLAEDPSESTNLIHALPEVRNELYKKFKEIEALNSQYNQNIKPDKIQFDNELKKQLEELGYI